MRVGTFAVLALLVGWHFYRWPGVAMAATLAVLYILVQFNYALRTMRIAASAKLGHVDSALMLNARLKKGMTLLQVMKLTTSLGHKVTDAPETWAWMDAEKNSIALVFESSRLSHWTLKRPENSPN